MFNEAVKEIANNPQKHFSDGCRTNMRKHLSTWKPKTPSNGMMAQMGEIKRKFNLGNKQAAAVVLAWNLYLL